MYYFIIFIGLAINHFTINLHMNSKISLEYSEDACEVARLGGVKPWLKYAFREAFYCEDVGKNWHSLRISKVYQETMSMMLYMDAE